MTAEIRRNLFLTIKEALHNISKHARARNVLMKIAVAGKKISIEIKDDGIGFNPDNSSNLGNGLSNMERRVLECGGQIKIFSSENNGTSISLSMDL
jgi:signal transduction histidine kinase